MLYAATPKPSPVAEKELLTKALQLTASKGGDGLLVKQAFYLPPRLVGRLQAGYRLTGLAIKGRG